jgi:hypothetical protein
MARSPDDIVELFGAYLLGVVSASAVAIIISFRENLRYPLGKAALAVLIFLFLRLLATIRLGTSSLMLCNIWIQTRVSFTLWAINTVNFGYVFTLLPRYALVVLSSDANETRSFHVDHNELVVIVRVSFHRLFFKITKSP